LRILQVNKFVDVTLPAAGGPGTYLSGVAGRLREAGHSVFYFGCRTGDQPEGAETPARPPFVDYLAPGGLAEKITGAMRIVHDARAARYLDAFLSRCPVDVAHVHNIYHHLTPSIFPVLRRRGIPIVMTVHDYRMLCPARAFLRRGRLCRLCYPHRYWHCLVHRCGGGLPASAAVAFETFFQRFFRRYIQNLYALLCPSRFMAGMLRGDGFPANKVRVMHNPIEPMELPDGISPRDGVLLSVGRVSKEKGFDLLLDLCEARPGLEVMIVGDGPQLSHLQSEASRRSLQNVTFTGHVPADQLGRYYAQASAVIVPSRFIENSPYSMLEGMSAGRCVIAAAHEPILEWISDGQTGRVFRPADAADLIRVVDEVLKDKDGRSRVGSQAAALVRLRHDPNVILRQLLDVYEEAIRQCA